MIRHMASEYTVTQMEQSMKETGDKTSSMDMGKKHGLMGQVMKENMKKEGNMDMESLNGQIKQTMMENSEIITLKE